MVSFNLNFLTPFSESSITENAVVLSAVAALGVLLTHTIYKTATTTFSNISKKEKEQKIEKDRILNATLDLTIIGGGISGLTTAFFAGQEKLAPVVIMGDDTEAQLPLIKEIKNLAGHVDGISGEKLYINLRQQANKFGALLKTGHVVDVDFSAPPYKIILASGKTISSKAVVIAIGTFKKRLGLPSETRLKGRGIYDSAISDAPLCKGKQIIVIGGGNSAMGEVLELVKFAKKITILYETKIYASSTIVEAVRKTNKVEIFENTQVTEVCGEEWVCGVKAKNLETQVTKTYPADGVFVSNGRPVNTALFKNKLEMDQDGVIKVCSGKTGTSVQGVFVVGDARRALKYRKLSTAAGDGAEAAIDVKEYLERTAKKN